jgi:hypothetical protein
MCLLLAMASPFVLSGQTEQKTATPDSAQSVVPENKASDVADRNILADVVIEGSFEAEFEEDKPAVHMVLDFSNVVQFDDGMSWQSADPLVLQKRRDGDNGSMAMRLSAPEIALIRPAPVKSFRAEFNDLRRWKLTISAADGSIFRTITGVGNPLDTIAWDGLSDRGEPLRAGENYAYHFTAVDKAGNQGSFPGETFTVPAFCLELGSVLMVGLDARNISPENGLHLNPAAHAYASEIASLIRYYSRTGTVRVETGFSDAEDFVELLANDLVMAPEQIQIRRIRNAGDRLTFYIE